jgi:hypothetical protein
MSLLRATHAKEHRSDQPAKDPLNTNPYRPVLGFGSWSLQAEMKAEEVKVLIEDIGFEADVISTILVENEDSAAFTY